MPLHILLHSQTTRRIFIGCVCGNTQKVHTPDIHRMCVWKHTEGYTRTMKHVHHSGLTEQYDEYWIRIFPLVEHTDLWSWCDKACFMLLDMPSWLTQKSSNLWSVSSVKPSITFHTHSLGSATQREPMSTPQHLVVWNRFGSQLLLIVNAYTNSHCQGYTLIALLRLSWLHLLLGHKLNWGHTTRALKNINFYCCRDTLFNQPLQQFTLEHASFVVWVWCTSVLGFVGVWAWVPLDIDRLRYPFGIISPWIQVAHLRDQSSTGHSKAQYSSRWSCASFNVALLLCIAFACSGTTSCGSSTAQRTFPHDTSLASRPLSGTVMHRARWILDTSM